MSKLPLSLMIAAAIPFVALSLAVSMHMFTDIRELLSILLTYAAVILSFLGGIHWGIAVAQYADRRTIANLLVAESVWPSLVAWGILFRTSTYTQLLVMTILYALVWAADSLLYSNNIIPQWFFTLRCIITPIVVVSLYVAYFGLI